MSKSNWMKELNIGSMRHYTYSRKDKSLGLLCQKFLDLYNHDGVTLIGLDEAATRLDVERRRIYDIVNVLESIGVLARKGKNQYSWIGFGGIPQALEMLKEEALKEVLENSFELRIASDDAKNSEDEEEGESSCHSSQEFLESSQHSNQELLESSQHSSQEFPSGCSPTDILPKPSTSDNNGHARVECRKEKSLGLLTRNFVKLFLTTKAEIVSLEEAAVLLLGESNDSVQMRSTKVRRLYDIANVLSSVNLIEKTHHNVTRKPAFIWLGIDGRTTKRADTPTVTESCNEGNRKRVFGTDISSAVNIDARRVKLNEMPSAKNDLQKRSTDGDMHNWEEREQVRDNNLTDRQKGKGKKPPARFVFGPFLPTNLNDRSNARFDQGLDWEAIAASYHPQYCNQEINDLFDHYYEAWHAWKSLYESTNGVRIDTHGAMR